MTFFSRPVIREMAGGAFHKRLEETDFDQVEGDLMESIQQALYEAESFLPFICPMKAKHLVRPNIWKL